MCSARPSVAAVLTVAAAAALAATAAAQTGPVTFEDHIRPIMERTCWNCHGAAAQLSGLDLRTRAGALEGGAKGPALVPGRAEDSRLFRMVAGLDQPAMPMGGEHLTDAEVAALRAWIDQGAHWDTGGATPAAAALAALEGGDLRLARTTTGRSGVRRAPRCRWPASSPTRWTAFSKRHAGRRA